MEKAGIPSILRARGAAVCVIAMVVFAVACSGGGSRPAPTATTTVEMPPQATGTPVFGTPIAPPPTPLPVERGIEDSSEGIGVYPSMLGFADALRGHEYFGTVGVQNGGPRDHTYRFEVTGDTAPWLTFVSTDRTSPLAQVDVQPHNSAQVLVKAVVPAGVPNGDYGGTIRVLTTTADRAGAESSGAGVTIGAEVSVFLAVTGTQKIDGQFVDVGASNVESGHPLRIQSQLVNTGNVDMNPTIDVDILGAFGNAIDHVSFAVDPVYPNDRKQITNEWPTQERPVGDYVGRVSVRFGDLDLGTKEVRFSVVPVGTYSRRGELRDVHLTNAPRVGDLAKLVAVFKNTGEIETKGKFLGELYMGDRLIAPLTSEEQLLLPGGTADLEILARIAENGTYTVKGKINYEGRETDTQEFHFRIGEEGGTPALTWALIFAGIAAAMVVISAGGWMLRRKKAAAR